MKTFFLNDEGEQPMLPPGKFAAPGSRSEAVEKAWQTRRGYSPQSDLAKDTGDDAKEQTKAANQSPKDKSGQARAMIAHESAYEAHMDAAREAEKNGDYGEAMKHAQAAQAHLQARGSHQLLTDKDTIDDERDAQEQEHEQEEREGGDRSAMVPKGEVKARPIKERALGKTGPHQAAREAREKAR